MSVDVSEIIEREEKKAGEQTINDALYVLKNKLANRHDWQASLDMAIKALETQDPMDVYYFGDGFADGEMVYDMASCQKCGYDFEEGDQIWGMSFCPCCGQALNWKTEDENGDGSTTESTTESTTDSSIKESGLSTDCISRKTPPADMKVLNLKWIYKDSEYSREAFERGRQRGREEMKELALEVYRNYDCNEWEEIFGTSNFGFILTIFPFEEISEMVRVYKEKQYKRGGKIETGDVVLIKEGNSPFNGEKFVVTNLFKKEGEEYAQGLKKNGNYILYEIRFLKKTGQHLNVAEILKQIGE